MRAILTFLKSERFLFLLVLTPFVYIAFAVLFHGIPDLPNSGDAAVLELSTRNVFSNRILLGPYSRFMFFHPGPLYFQLRYPVYTLFGERNSSLLIATVMIQICCLFFAWKTIKGSAGGSIASMFTVSSAIFLLATEKTVWLSEWNPYIIMLPLMLFAVSMAAAVSGRQKYFPIAVVAGSLAAQTHIAVVPSMAVIVFFAVLFSVYPRFITSSKKIDFHWKPVLIGLGILFLLWAVPLYQQFFPGSREGNMTSIVHFFSESTPDVNHDKALNLWSAMLTDVELGGQAGQGLRYAVIATRVLLLGAVFVIQRKKGDKSFLSALAFFALLLHGVSWFSVLQIRGQLNDYLVQWVGVIPLLSLTAILGFLMNSVGQSSAKYMNIAAAVFLVYASVALPLRTADFFRTELHPSWQNEIAVRELSAQLADNMNWEEDTFYLVSLVTTDQWPLLFGILNSMEKMDLPVGVEDNLLYRPSPVPQGMHSRILHLGTLNEQGLSSPGLMAEWNGIGLILE